MVFLTQPKAVADVIEAAAKGAAATNTADGEAGVGHFAMKTNSMEVGVRP